MADSLQYIHVMSEDANYIDTANKLSLSDVLDRLLGLIIESLLQGIMPFWSGYHSLKAYFALVIGLRAQFIVLSIYIS